MDIETKVSLPLDADGFVRRECPSCEQEFKWKPTDSPPPGHEPRPGGYFCPQCGKQAKLNQYFTKAQARHIQETSADATGDYIADQLTKPFKKSGSRAGFSVDVKSRSTAKKSLPSEPNDMVVATSPCHPEEPVKLPESHRNDAFCLICGTKFPPAGKN